MFDVGTPPPLVFVQNIQNIEVSDGLSPKIFICKGLRAKYRKQRGTARGRIRGRSRLTFYFYYTAWSFYYTAWSIVNMPKLASASALFSEV
jgi:hypothetical protein